MSLTKEEKALEALIKLVVELEDYILEGQVTSETLVYAKEALKANGWEVYRDELARVSYRRISHSA